MTVRLKIANFLHTASLNHRKQNIKKSLPYLQITGSYRLKCLTGSEQILEPEVKKYIFEKLAKNCFESLSLVFLIFCHMMPLEVFEVLSVAMTSSPEVVRNIFSFMNSLVLGSTEFNSELRFPIVYGPSLRSASVLTLARCSAGLAVHSVRSLSWPIFSLRRRLCDSIRTIKYVQYSMAHTICHATMGKIGIK